MPLNIPAVPLKYFLIAHFVLVTWAALYLWLGECYIYSNYLVLIVGLWALRDKNSQEPMQFLLGIHLFTILNDIILLGMYFQDTNDTIKITITAACSAKDTQSCDSIKSRRTRFQFTAAMAIMNLLLKLVSAIFMFKEYQTRAAGGQAYEDLGAEQGAGAARKQESAPPTYAPSSGYMPPTSANAPYNQGSY